MLEQNKVNGCVVRITDRVSRRLEQGLSWAEMDHQSGAWDAPKKTTYNGRRHHGEMYSTAAFSGK